MTAPSSLTPGAAAAVGPNFRTNPDAFNTITIAGITAPGIAKVSHTKKHDWDKKKSKGATGGTATFTGNPLVEFTVEYYLWEAAHFDAWPAFAAMQRQSLSVPAVTAPQNVSQALSGAAPIVTSPATTQPVALDVYHPILAEINVLRCIVEEEGSLTPDGRGGAKYVWKYAEYNPPRPAGGTASSSVSGTGGANGAPAQPTPQTAFDKMIAHLSARMAALGG